MINRRGREENPTNCSRKGIVVKQSVVNQVQRWPRIGREGAGVAVISSARPRYRIMADGPRCLRRKQTKPRRTNGEWTV